MAEGPLAVFAVFAGSALVDRARADTALSLPAARRLAVSSTARHGLVPAAERADAAPSFTKYLSVTARATRQALKEEARVKAETRSSNGMRYQVRAEAHGARRLIQIRSGRTARPASRCAEFTLAVSARPSERPWLSRNVIRS